MPFDGLPEGLLSDLVKLRVALDGVKRGWCSHEFGQEGEPQHCAIGWLLEATGWNTGEATRLALRYLYPVLPEKAKVYGRLESIWTYNDDGDRKRIIKLFDDAGTVRREAGDVIDYGFEDRLVQQIYLRELIASVDLSARARRVLRGHLQGQTFTHIAHDEGLSTNRICQIFRRSVRQLQHKVRAAETEFDKVAFLQHMQGLARKQAEHEQQIFEYERAKLEWMLGKEREPEPPSKPPVPEWLLERLWDAGEYLQVYRYLAYQITLRDEGL